MTTIKSESQSDEKEEMQPKLQEMDEAQLAAVYGGVTVEERAWWNSLGGGVQVAGEVSGVGGGVFNVGGVDPSR